MDSNQGNIIINPVIARRGVEPRKDIMPNICQSLATLVLSSSNVMKQIQTDTYDICAFAFYFIIQVYQ